VWEVSTPHLDIYEYRENNTLKYGFGIHQNFLTPIDYWQPDRETIVLEINEGIKLGFGLYYTGEPNTAETFMMTISFHATSEDLENPIVMLEELKNQITELPSEAFKSQRFPERQKRRLFKQIDKVIKRVENDDYKWAIKQLEQLKLQISMQILDPYKVSLIEKIDEIIINLQFAI
jgi:hypothetical protein